jgi:hypothetical protein
MMSVYARNEDTIGTLIAVLLAISRATELLLAAIVETLTGSGALRAALHSGKSAVRHTLSQETLLGELQLCNRLPRGIIGVRTGYATDDTDDESG